MYLGIKTDSPVAELYLFECKHRRADATWQADRQLARELLGRVETFLREHDVSFNDLTGVFVYRGPGSFTGLRIGITVINTIAYANSLQLVGSEGEGWLELAVERLARGDSDEVVLPLYGAEARITKPIK